MALQYVHTGYIYTAVRQHITYVTTRPTIYGAPGIPSPVPGVGQQVQPAVNLDALIAKRREKARRMKQR